MKRLARLFIKREVPKQDVPQQKFTPPSTGRMAVRDRYEDIRNIITTEEPIIIDGGGHTGLVTDLFLRQYTNPRVHVFEPIPELSKLLTEKYQDKPNVEVHPVALGAEAGNLDFNILQYPSSSSILAPTEANIKYNGNEKIDVAKIVKVDVVRLDEILSGPVDILKLDLQGYELEALKGCENLFAQTHIIVTEVEFMPLYHGQPLFSEIELFLRERGFSLLNLYDLWTHPDGQLTAGDAVFVNTKF